MKDIKEYFNKEEKISEASSNSKLWDKIDELKEELGAEKLLEEFCHSMSDDELEQNLKWICKNYDIKF